MSKKTVLVFAAVLATLATGFLLATPAKPKTVVHIITVQWKADASPAQIDKAIKAAENMNYPGLKNVWTKPLKLQVPEGYKNVIVMEFESQEALNKYSGSEAQKNWYAAYMPVREESQTSDITN